MQTIVIGALPLAFAAMAQSVIIIAGGIDLSLGDKMAIVSVIAASLMQGKSFGARAR